MADLLSLKCDGPIGLLRGVGLEQHEYEFLHGALMHERSNNLKSKSAMEVFIQQKQSILLENKRNSALLECSCLVWSQNCRVLLCGQVPDNSRLDH